MAMALPLNGVRVLELTNILAGPYAGYLLGLLGAEVVKVEVPGAGDLSRLMGSSPALNRAHMGAAFLSQNAGKKSLTLNLKHPDGKALFRRLVTTADVLLENFRPGVLERLGLGYAVLRELRPRLVYCAISGFGQDGPLRDYPAFDQIIQGLSGVMSVTGEPAATYRVGYPVSDTVAGLNAAIAISAALAGCARTGEGCCIDVSMLDAQLSAMGWLICTLLTTGQVPGPIGNHNEAVSPSGAFRTRDATLNIAANTQEKYEALCRVIGRPQLVTDPRYRDGDVRKVNRAALSADLEAALAAKPATEWEALLNAAGVPAGQVLDIGQAMAHPQVAHRRTVHRFDPVVEGTPPLRVLAGGFRLGAGPAVPASPPPRVGQHTAELLRGLGLDDADLQRLRAAGVV